MNDIQPETLGKRVLCEFTCTNCNPPSYIYVHLNIELEGNHVVVCPLCNHEHYRVVKKGIITEDRYNNTLKNADRIIPMKSAAEKTKRTLGKIALFRQMEATGMAK